MVIWKGILKVKPRKREKYIEKIKEENFIEKFTAQPGNKFYTIGAVVDDENALIVCDGWTDMETFRAHDSSKEVELWRKIYKKYVADCVSELFEF